MSAHFHTPPMSRRVEYHRGTLSDGRRIVLRTIYWTINEARGATECHGREAIINGELGFETLDAKAAESEDAD